MGLTLFTQGTHMVHIPNTFKVLEGNLSRTKRTNTVTMSSMQPLAVHIDGEFDNIKFLSHL